MTNWKWALTALLAAALLAGLSATRGEGGNSTSEPSSKPADDLKAQVTAILIKKQCAKCHKTVDRVMARIVPGSAEKSRLYQQITNGHKRKGPKRGVCTDDELKVIADWINSMSPASQPASQPHKEPNT